MTVVAAYDRDRRNAITARAYCGESLAFEVHYAVLSETYNTMSYAADRSFDAKYLTQCLAALEEPRERLQIRSKESA